MKHFVITRFGLGISDESWYEYRISLFKSVTFNSLKSQTNKNFTWIILVDPLISESANAQLAQCKAEFPQIEIVTFAPLEDLVWDVVPRKMILEYCSDEWILTTRIDDDDAWRRDYVEKLQKYANENLGEEKGAGIEFPEGWEIDISGKTVAHLRYHFHSMGYSILTRRNELYTVYDGSHSDMAKNLEQRGYKLIVAENSEKMWLYIRHRQAISPANRIKAASRHKEIDWNTFEFDRFGVNPLTLLETSNAQENAPVIGPISGGIDILEQRKRLIDRIRLSRENGNSVEEEKLRQDYLRLGAAVPRS